MKILVIIKVPEPLLMNTGFWETNQLSLLHTRHKITSSLKKSGSQAPWSWESQASQPIPILVSYPSLGLRPSRTSVPLFSHVVVAMGLSSALCTCHGGSNMVMS